ncbi:hypothetical protein VTK73DRAFT_1532 [Phialemonium thermophilum]|uniref:Uncharacterized protein n=1 Tax=Phialemonium thermophilum TaxID=223376 RepID=A0ABR3VTD7_9PEZI
MEHVHADRPSQRARARLHPDTKTHGPARPSSASIASVVTDWDEVVDDPSRGAAPLRPALGLGDVSTAVRRALRSFVESIGPAIDPCDPYTTLAASIVERALIRPELLSALICLGERRHLTVAARSSTSPAAASDLIHGEVDALLSAFLARLIDNVQGEFVRRLPTLLSAGSSLPWT